MFDATQRAATRRLLILFVLLLPSAQFAWRYRDMPRFGYLHDDAILFGSARTLATEGDYRILSLPQTPYQTKYPPLYPAYMSLVWRLNPEFPENLKLATLLNWILLIPWLGLSWALYRRHGFGEYEAVSMVAIMAINPNLVLFGTSVLTDVFYTCILLVVLGLMDYLTPRMALLAGVLAGCAYLCRTAGVALLISGPLWYLWNRSRRCAFAFVAGMIPFVTGWMLWIRFHRMPTTDPALLFYTDYLQFQFANVGWDDLARVTRVNLRELFYGLGSLVFPRVVDSLLLKIAAAVVAFAGCVGIVRMAQIGKMRPYALFVLVSAGMLIVWHFPPNERFVLPFYPLLLAGLFTEIQHLYRQLSPAFKSAEYATRAAAYLLSSTVAIMAGTAIFLQLSGTFRFLPELMEQERVRQSGRRAVYTWMASHLPRPAHVLSAEDTALYLYTGLQGITVISKPRDWYENRPEAVADLYAHIALYCRSKDIGYFFLGRDDLALHWTQGGDIDELDRAVRENPELVAIHSTDAGTVYRVGPSGQ